LTTYLVGLDGQTVEARDGSPENPAIPLSALTMENWLGASTGSLAGERVTHDRALSYSPIWQGVNRISGDVARMPLHVFRRLDGSDREIEHGHPAEQLINQYGTPNEELTSYLFWRRYMTSALLWGAGYAWIDRAGDGTPIGLYNLLPDRTRPFRHKGQLKFLTETWENDDPSSATIEVLPAEDVLYIEGLSIDGTGACDMVRYAREDFGLALAARRFTSRFFANGAQAGGILQVPPGATQIAQDKVEDGLRKKHTGGDNAFRVMVLRDGFRWFSTSVDPDKAQLIELDEAQVRHAARWLNLPPEFLGVKESVSYNSLEASKQGYLDATLSHWLTAIRSAANQRLIPRADRERRRRFIDYQINALLWTDAQTRATIAQSGILSGRFSPDETRAWENMPARPDGNGHRFLRPVNTEYADTPEPEPGLTDQPDPEPEE
jgi:HK97 family phage portal protein